MRIEPKISAREILAAINEWARVCNPDEAQILWSIFTALRGPDNDDWELKHSHTVPIRFMVLSNLAQKSYADTFVYHPEEMYNELKALLKPTQDHFKVHVRLAVEAILSTEETIEK